MSCKYKREECSRKCICRSCYNWACDYIENRCNRSSKNEITYGECEYLVVNYDQMLDYLTKNEKIIDQCNKSLVRDLEAYKEENQVLSDNILKNYKPTNDKLKKDNESLKIIVEDQKIELAKLKDENKKFKEDVKSLISELKKYKPDEYTSKDYDRFKILELDKDKE